MERGEKRVEGGKSKRNNLLPLFVISIFLPPPLLILQFFLILRICFYSFLTFKEVQEQEAKNINYLYEG